jgi:hypothetical protein
MNAPATITVSTIDQAIERANDWVRVARPIIKACFLMDDAHLELSRARLDDPKGFASYGQMSPAARDWAEADRHIDRCREELNGMLEGIRDNALCDERMSGPQESEPADPIARQVWDNAWVDTEEFNDQLDRDVMSISAAIKLVENEL